MYWILLRFADITQSNSFCEMDAVQNGWFSEISEELWPGQCYSLKVKEILHKEKSEYQDIKVIDT